MRHLLLVLHTIGLLVRMPFNMFFFVVVEVFEITLIVLFCSHEIVFSAT